MTSYTAQYALTAIRSMGATLMDAFDVTSRDQTMVPAPTFKPFRFEVKRAKLDWRVLFGVDIDNLIRDVDLDTLERVVGIIAYGDIEAEGVRELSETNFTRVFRLAQLMIEYLLYVQDCLQATNQWLQQDRANSDKYVQAARARIRELEATLKSAKREARHARDTVKTYEMLAAAGGGKFGSAHLVVAGGDMASGTAGQVAAPMSHPSGGGIADMETSPSRIDMDLAGLSERLARTQAESAQLRNERDEMLHQMREIDAAIRGTRGGGMVMRMPSVYDGVDQEQLNRAQHETRRAQSQIDRLQGEVAKLLLEKQQLAGDRDRLLREMSTGGTRPDGNGGAGGGGGSELSAMLLESGGRVQQLEAELADSQRDIGALQKQLMKAMKDAAGAKPTASTGALSMAGLEDIQAALQALQDQNQQLGAIITRQAQDAEESKRAHNQHVQDLTGEMDFMQEKLVSSQRQLADARLDITRLERAKAEALAAAEVAKQRSAGGLQRLVPDDVRELKQMVFQLQARNEQAATEVDSLDSQLRLARSERDRLAADFARQGDELDRARGGGTAGGRDGPTEAGRTGGWRAEELERLRSQNAELGDTLRERDAAIGRLRDTIRQLEAQLRQYGWDGASVLPPAAGVVSIGGARIGEIARRDSVASRLSADMPSFRLNQSKDTSVASFRFSAGGLRASTAMGLPEDDTAFASPLRNNINNNSASSTSWQQQQLQSRSRLSHQQFTGLPEDPEAEGGGYRERDRYLERDRYPERDSQRDGYSQQDGYQDRDGQRDRFPERDGQRDKYQQRDSERDRGYVSPPPALRHSQVVPPTVPRPAGSSGGGGGVQRLPEVQAIAVRSKIMERTAGLQPEQLSQIIHDELRVITEEPFVFEGGEEDAFRRLLPSSVQGRRDVLCTEKLTSKDLELALQLYKGRVQDDVDTKLASFGLAVDAQAMTEQEYVAMMRELQARRTDDVGRLPLDMQQRAQTLRDGLLTHLDLAWRRHVLLPPTEQLRPTDMPPQQVAGSTVPPSVPPSALPAGPWSSATALPPRPATPSASDLRASGAAVALRSSAVGGSRQYGSGSTTPPDMSLREYHRDSRASVQALMDSGTRGSVSAAAAAAVANEMAAAAGQSTAAAAAAATAAASDRAAEWQGSAAERLISALPQAGGRWVGGPRGFGAPQGDTGRDSDIRVSDVYLPEAPRGRGLYDGRPGSLADAVTAWGGGGGTLPKRVPPVVQQYSSRRDSGTAGDTSEPPPQARGEGTFYQMETPQAVQGNWNASLPRYGAASAAQDKARTGRTDRSSEAGSTGSPRRVSYREDERDMAVRPGQQQDMLIRTAESRRSDLSGTGGRSPLSRTSKKSENSGHMDESGRRSERLVLNSTGGSQHLARTASGYSEASGVGGGGTGRRDGERYDLNASSRSDAAFAIPTLGDDDDGGGDGDGRDTFNASGTGVRTGGDESDFEPIPRTARSRQSEASRAGGLGSSVMLRTMSGGMGIDPAATMMMLERTTSRHSAVGGGTAGGETAVAAGGTASLQRTISRESAASSVTSAAARSTAPSQVQQSRPSRDDLGSTGGRTPGGTQQQPQHQQQADMGASLARRAAAGAFTTVASPNASLKHTGAASVSRPPHAPPLPEPMASDSPVKVTTAGPAAAAAFNTSIRTRNNTSIRNNYASADYDDEDDNLPPLPLPGSRYNNKEEHDEYAVTAEDEEFDEEDEGDFDDEGGAGVRGVPRMLGQMPELKNSPQASSAASSRHQSLTRDQAKRVVRPTTPGEDGDAASSPGRGSQRSGASPTSRARAMMREEASGVRSNVETDPSGQLREQLSSTGKSDKLSSSGKYSDKLSDTIRSVRGAGGGAGGGVAADTTDARSETTELSLPPAGAGGEGFVSNAKLNDSYKTSTPCLSPEPSILAVDIDVGADSGSSDNGGGGSSSGDDGRSSGRRGGGTAGVGGGRYGGGDGGGGGGGRQAAAASAVDAQMRKMSEDGSVM